MTMMRNWPTGSVRRDRGARESGTNSAVSETAASPTGMFAQKMPRQPTIPTSTPPSTGPSAMDRPYTPAHTRVARGALGGAGEVFLVDAERRGVEHRAADALQDPEADQPAQAGCQAAQ